MLILVGMKLSKRKITAKKIQRNKNKRLIRRMRNDINLFAKILFPNMKVPCIYGNLQPKNNPFVYSEGIQNAYGVAVRNNPQVNIVMGIDCGYIHYAPRNAGKNTLKTMLKNLTKEVRNWIE